VTGPSWLVVNADDFGVSRGSTLGVVKAHREGIVTSASLAVVTEHFALAVESAKQCPDLGIGLHLTLTSGRPVADRGRVPMLVNDAGFFRWRFTSLLNTHPMRVPGLHAQLALEIDAQFARLADSGIKADHVNGERHAHLIPGIFELVVEAAKRFGVRWVRAARDIGPQLVRARDVPALLLTGGFIKSSLLGWLTSKAKRQNSGMTSPDHVASYLYTGRTRTFLPMLLASPPRAGVTEVMVHPGFPEEDGDVQLGNRELERYVASPARRDELDACIGARGQLGAWRLTNFGQLNGQRA
jgi:predicted glycoside hydrolase/deacetylase ChbG (UPF0249 family)